MVRKFLIKLLKGRELILEELRKECFPEPKYTKCCSEGEQKEVIKKREELEDKHFSTVSLGTLTKKTSKKV